MQPQPYSSIILLQAFSRTIHAFSRQSKDSFRQPKEADRFCKIFSVIIKGNQKPGGKGQCIFAFLAEELPLRKYADILKKKLSTVPEIVLSLFSAQDSVFLLLFIATIRYMCSCVILSMSSWLGQGSPLFVPNWV